jgi:hypothetical protein
VLWLFLLAATPVFFGKSYTIKKLFAKCYLKEEIVVSLHLNSPFDGLVPSENLVVSGGQELNLPKVVLQTTA